MDKKGGRNRRRLIFFQTTDSRTRSQKTLPLGCWRPMPPRGWERSGNEHPLGIRSAPLFAEAAKRAKSVLQTQKGSGLDRVWDRSRPLLTL